MQLIMLFMCNVQPSSPLALTIEKWVESTSFALLISVGDHLVGAFVPSSLVLLLYLCL